LRPVPGYICQFGAAFAQTDDDIKSRLDSVSETVKAAKDRLAAIKADHQMNQERLAAFTQDPEVTAMLAELDRARVQECANIVESAQTTMSTVMIRPT